jgi:glucose-1-phosphate thymidylyltransferase
VKGIILAGGLGTRLDPLTRAVSKQLLPVYDKPMVYYPLSTLILSGIKEIAIISSPQHLDAFQKLLGTGKDFNVEFTYIPQDKPRGIADAFIVAKGFINGSSVALILGDNLFYGQGLGRQLAKNRNLIGAKIFAYRVSNPSQYGVVTLNDKGEITHLEEKPSSPTSELAIPGLYFFDSQVSEIAQSVTPSSRGELEIIDVIREYWKLDQLTVDILERGTAWLDTGTAEGLFEASSFVRAIQHRQGLSLGDPKMASNNVIVP